MHRVRHCFGVQLADLRELETEALERETKFDMVVFSAGLGKKTMQKKTATARYYPIGLQTNILDFYGSVPNGP